MCTDENQEEDIKIEELEKKIEELRSQPYDEAAKKLRGLETELERWKEIKRKPYF